MQRRRKFLAFAIAFALVAVVMTLAGIGIGSTLEHVADSRAGPDSVELIVADASAKLGTDAAVSFTVLSSAQTVKDSTIACAVYRTADDRIGLMTPAYVVRRVNRSTVQPSYDRNVASRCTPLLEANGLAVTASTVHPVLEWRMLNRSHEQRKRAGTRA